MPTRRLRSAVFDKQERCWVSGKTTTRSELWRANSISFTHPCQVPKILLNAESRRTFLSCIHVRNVPWPMHDLSVLLVTQQQQRSNLQPSTYRKGKTWEATVREKWLHEEGNETYLNFKNPSTFCNTEENRVCEKRGIHEKAATPQTRRTYSSKALYTVSSNRNTCDGSRVELQAEKPMRQMQMVHCWEWFRGTDRESTWW